MFELSARSNNKMSMNKTMNSKILNETIKNKGGAILVL